MHSSSRADRASRLLIVSQFYAPETIGSAPYVTDLAEWFASRGVDVAVLAARPHYPEYRVPDAYRDGRRDRERIAGVHVWRMPTPVLGGGAAGRIVLETMLALRVFARLRRAPLRAYDRVLSLCPSVLMVHAVTRSLTRSGRHVAMVHDIQSGLASGLRMVGGRALPALMRSVERRTFNRATAVVVLAEEMRSVLQRQGVVRPIEVLPIWVDTDRIVPLPRTPGPPTVLYAGNFGRKQGLDQVLDAAARLGELVPDARIVLRGDGSRAQELRTRVTEDGLTNVSFQPLVPASEFGASLADGDVHLAPQAADGARFAVPSKAYSVMAAGRPLVATAAPGSPLARLADASGGIECVPPDSPEEFASRLAALLQDPDRRGEMGRRGRSWVEHNASRDNVLAAYGELLALDLPVPADRSRQLQS